MVTATDSTFNVKFSSYCHRDCHCQPECLPVASNSESFKLNFNLKLNPYLPNRHHWQAQAFPCVCVSCWAC